MHQSDEFPHPVDANRLADVVSYALLDADLEERFDRVVRFARRIFRCDAALVTLVDADGTWATGTEPALAMDCGEVFDHPGTQLYGAEFVRGPDGRAVGRLCVFGDDARSLSDDERASLGELAGIVGDEIAAAAIGTSDEMTSLANRRGFELVGRSILEVCRRAGRRATLLFLDLDHLKEINDGLGHQAGDRALCAFGRILTETYRASDVVARIGGDEFAVLLTATGDPDPAVEKLADAVRDWNDRSDEPFELAASLGMARFDPSTDLQLEDLLARADADMYRDKRTG